MIIAYPNRRFSNNLGYTQFDQPALSNAFISSDVEGNNKILNIYFDSDGNEIARQYDCSIWSVNERRNV